MAGLVCAEKRTIHPQHPFPFIQKPAIWGLDSDGATIQQFNLEKECKDKYFVLFFFPMDFKADSSEILAFDAMIDKFKDNNTRVFGVTQDSPYVIRHWCTKPAENGGFGHPIRFPILSDKDQSFAQLLGIAQTSGLPARATFIVDWKGHIRYMLVQSSRLGRSARQIYQLAVAFRHSDLTGMITLPNWVPGDEHIPTDFTDKCKYYRKKYGKAAAAPAQAEPSGTF